MFTKAVYLIKIQSFYEILLQFNVDLFSNFISCDGKAEVLAAITPSVLSVT